jgi:hypothetical protein
MRSPGRKRPVPRSREGGYRGYNLGPQVPEASGFVYPSRFLVRQRGVLVPRWYGPNSTRDRPDRY